MNELVKLNVNERNEKIVSLLKRTSLKDTFLFEMKDSEKAELLLSLFQPEGSADHYYCMVKLYAWMGAKFRTEVIKYAKAYREIAPASNPEWVFVAYQYSEALVGEYDILTAYEAIQDVVDADWPYIHNLYSKILYRLNRLQDAVDYLKQRKVEVSEKRYFEEEEKQMKLQNSVQRELEQYEHYIAINKRYIPATQKGKDLLGITDEIAASIFGSFEVLTDFHGKDFVCFDFETTGFNSSSNEIIDIGAVRVRNGEIVDTFQSLVKPANAITPRITQITHITNEMVESAPLLEHTLPKFLEFVGDDILLGHNVIFDLRFLVAACSKTGSAPIFKAMDTLSLSRRYSSTKKHNLGVLCDHYEVELRDAHRALPDAMATAEIYLKMFEKYK